MSMAAIKRTGRVGLCEWCGQPVYEGRAWGDPQWWHEKEPRHEITPVYISTPMPDGSSASLRNVHLDAAHLEPPATPIPDQVLTPLSLDALWAAYDGEFYRWKVSGDGDPDHRREAVEAAIRAPLEARIAYLSGEDSQLVARILFLECENETWKGLVSLREARIYELERLLEAAALAGVPKEAGEGWTVAKASLRLLRLHSFLPERVRGENGELKATGLCDYCLLRYDAYEGHCDPATKANFDAAGLGVVAAPVEDANGE